MLEKEIEKNILCFLEEIGIFAWKNKSMGTYDYKRGIFRKNTNRFAINGVSDIIGILHDGRALFIEVKNKQGIVSDYQRVFLAKVQERGAIAFVSRSVEQTWAQLSPFLKNPDKLLHIVNRHLKAEAAH